MCPPSVCRCGPGRSRTCDLGIKSPLLYQLSYRPWVPEEEYAPRMGKGYAEGSAVEERLAAMERGDDLHAQLDLRHSEAWNREVLRPLVAADPAVAPAIAEGALMRLACGARCFARYRREFPLG